MLENPEDLKASLEVPEQTLAQCENWKAWNKDHQVRTIIATLPCLACANLFYLGRSYRLALILPTFILNLNDTFLLGIARTFRNTFWTILSHHDFIISIKYMKMQSYYLSISMPAIENTDSL